MGNSVQLYGHARSVDINGFRLEMIQFCKTIMKYEPVFIYNEDESGFLYQLLPNITYLSPSEDRKEMRRVKAVKEKQADVLCVYECDWISHTSSICHLKIHKSQGICIYN